MRRRSFLEAACRLVGGVLPAAPSRGVAGVPVLVRCGLDIVFSPFRIEWEVHEM
ncbi:MAG: hypothetical protein [Microvirus sp.]|nr:MAG: hypothetical protein [Microvirus sp.]